jgi:hypothetical protein
LNPGEYRTKSPQSGVNMSDHLKRYRNYIDELKQGASSGISAAFGRATDLLPPEVMVIKAEPIDSAAQIIPLDSRVLAENTDSKLLRESVQALVQSCATELEDAEGRMVRTQTGTEEVLSVYFENGERMFMLSDLSVIDEATFRRSVVPDTSVLEASTDSAEEVNSSSSSSFDADGTESVSEELAQGSDQASGFYQDVSTMDGQPLWQVYYSSDGPELVSMADGGIIKRAEGRQEYIFSRLSQVDGDIKYFILTGFVVDPVTGNVYLEANEGAYTAAFLNSGWTIHQYRTALGVESFFVTEPVRPDRAPITMKVGKIDLDLSCGEVTYETIDGAARITLKSREL